MITAAIFNTESAAAAAAASDWQDRATVTAPAELDRAGRGVYIRCGVNKCAPLASGVLHLTERLLAQYARRVPRAAFQRRCEQFRRFVARIQPHPDAGGKGGETAATDGEPSDDLLQGVMSGMNAVGECIALANAAVAAACCERQDLALAEVLHVMRPAWHTCRARLRSVAALRPSRRTLLV